MLSDRLFSAIETAGGLRFCVQVVIRLVDRIDAQLLDRAAHELLRIEPYLSYRFEERGYQPRWARFAEPEQISAFELIETDDLDRTLQDVLARELAGERESAVKVYLIRGNQDVVCLKLDHKMGDGQAAKEIAALLAETYTRLAEDALSIFPVRPCGDRSLAQITRDMSRDHRRKLLAGMTRGESLMERPGAWFLPAPAAGMHAEERSRFVMRIIPAARHAAIFRYACRHRMTVNQVLMAAFQKGALDVFPHSEAESLLVLATVDLRRYLPGKKSDAPCNLAGLMALRVNPKHDSIDDLSSEVREQMLAARKGHMGLHRRIWRLELHPRARFLFNLVPFRIVKRSMVKRHARGARKEGMAGHLILTDIGALDPDRLSFAGVQPEHAFITSGTVTHPGILLLCLTEFSGMLTLSMGFDPHVLDSRKIEQFIEAMIAALPD